MPYRLFILGESFDIIDGCPHVIAWFNDALCPTGELKSSWLTVGACQATKKFGVAQCSPRSSTEIMVTPARGPFTDRDNGPDELFRISQNNSFDLYFGHIMHFSISSSGLSSDILAKSTSTMTKRSQNIEPCLHPIGADHSLS